MKNGTAYLLRVEMGNACSCSLLCAFAPLRENSGVEVGSRKGAKTQRNSLDQVVDGI
jgi:hypothetical protein